MYFFFSSRRRHTRSLCDWSSDVCSSDLYNIPRGRSVVAQRDREWPGYTQWYLCPVCSSLWTRSEERRVGKECRARWSLDHEKKIKDNGARVPVVRLWRIVIRVIDDKASM